MPSSLPTMPETTADLGAYISHIHDDDDGGRHQRRGHQPPADASTPLLANPGRSSTPTPTAGAPTIFGTSPTSRRPQLHRHRANRVLLYPGCFNPPHVAHSALLRRAFESTADLGVVAAIVLPLDDDRLEAKRQERRERELKRACGSGGVQKRKERAAEGAEGAEGTSAAGRDELLLTREQRVALRRGCGAAVGGSSRCRAGAAVDGGIGGGWLWVYDRSEEEWHGFRERLADAVRRDGFELEFLCLLGADYVGRRGAPWGSWDCENLVVGEAGRAVDFVVKGDDGQSRLLSLAWCEKWAPAEEDEEAARQRVRDEVSWLVGVLSFYDRGYVRRQLDNDPQFYEKLVQEGVRASTEKTKKQWMCRRKRGQGQWLRYVPCPDDERTIHAGGSTKIRDSIASCAPGELLQMLEGTALNAEMLVEFIIEARGPDIHDTYRVFGLPWYYTVAACLLGCAITATIVLLKVFSV